MEDRWARDFLRQQAHDKRFDFEFIDYSIKEPFERKWKTNAKARIAQSRGTIVLIGPTTYRSEAVAWEIAETKRQAHPLIGIQTKNQSTYRAPAGVPNHSILRWNFDAIKRELALW